MQIEVSIEKQADDGQRLILAENPLQPEKKGRGFSFIAFPTPAKPFHIEPISAPPV